MYACTSLSQDGFHQRGLWGDLASLTMGWCPLPFDLQGAFMHMCNQGGLLTSRMRNMWSLIFSLGRARPPLSIVLLFSSWCIGPQGTNLQLFALGPHLSPASNGANHKLNLAVFCSLQFRDSPGLPERLGHHEPISP